MDKYLFQNCQKIVVFSKDNSEVLLAKRKGENDYDGIFSFIGGKMETTDKDLVAGIKREKDEEVGENFKIKVNPLYSTLNYFQKKDGNFMVLPHYYASFISGKIKLNEEYSEYKWVKFSDLEKFEPKIPNITEIATRLLRIYPLMEEKEFVLV